MADMERIIRGLHYIAGIIAVSVETEQAINSMVTIDDAVSMLEEQEAKIRQLRLALDIAKGTCKGIISEGR